MPAAQHIGCVRTASTSKSAPYMARRRIKVKEKYVNGRTIAPPIMKLRKRLGASNGPMADSYGKDNKFQNSIGVKFAAKLNDR